MTEKMGKLLAASATISVALFGWGYNLSQDVAQLKTTSQELHSRQMNLENVYLENQRQTNERMLDVIHKMDKRLLVLETIVTKKAPTNE
ncbi:hypothetical protein BFS86_09030 [Shewanella algae]|nr:hypothetical protein BFS86_09030 [Shewanella algae]